MTEIGVGIAVAVYYVILVIFCGEMARKRHRNVIAWVIAAMITGTWAIVILYFLPSTKEIPTEWAPSEQLKKLKKKD